MALATVGQSECSEWSDWRAAWRGVIVVGRAHLARGAVGRSGVGWGRGAARSLAGINQDMGGLKAVGGDRSHINIVLWVDRGFAGIPDDAPPAPCSHVPPTRWQQRAAWPCDKRGKNSNARSDKRGKNLRRARRVMCSASQWRAFRTMPYSPPASTFRQHVGSSAPRGHVTNRPKPQSHVTNPAKTSVVVGFWPRLSLRPHVLC